MPVLNFDLDTEKNSEKQCQWQLTKTFLSVIVQSGLVLFRALLSQKYLFEICSKERSKKSFLFYLKSFYGAFLLVKIQ